LGVPAADQQTCNTEYLLPVTKISFALHRWNYLLNEKGYLFICKRFKYTRVDNSLLNDYNSWQNSAHLNQCVLKFLLKLRINDAKLQSMLLFVSVAQLA